MKSKYPLIATFALLLSSNWAAKKIRNEVLNSFHSTMTLFLIENRSFPGEEENPILFQKNSDQRYFHILNLIESSTESDLYFLLEEIALPDPKHKPLNEVIRAYRQRLRIQNLVKVIKPNSDGWKLKNNALLGVSLAILVFDREISITRSPDVAFLREWLQTTTQILIFLKSYFELLNSNSTSYLQKKN